MKNVRESKLLDVWNVDAKPYKEKSMMRKNKRKKVQDLKNYFEFLEQWSKASSTSKKVSERVTKPFVL